MVGGAQIGAKGPGRGLLIPGLLWLGLAALLMAPETTVPKAEAPAPLPQPVAEPEPLPETPDLRQVNLPPPPPLAEEVAELPEEAVVPETPRPAPSVTEPEAPIETVKETPKFQPRQISALRAAPRPAPAPEPEAIPVTPLKALAPAPRPEEAPTEQPQSEPVIALAPSAPEPAPLAESPPLKSPRPESPRPESPPIETAAKLEVGQPEIKKGRALLRLLEHGAGPEIELAWPRQSAARASLYDILNHCFGMRLALMDSQGRLFAEEDGRQQQLGGAAWSPNLDRYSAFIRHPSGRLTAEEQRQLNRAGPGLKLVRLFPRSFDARLLGGLNGLIGADYGSLSQIQARYRLSGRTLLVETIDGDGRRYPGEIAIPAPRGCRYAAA